MSKWSKFLATLPRVQINWFTLNEISCKPPAEVTTEEEAELQEQMKRAHINDMEALGGPHPNRGKYT